MRVFSYWEGPVTWLERLSIATALATGHELTVFSHNPKTLRLAGLGVPVEDAREIMDDPSLDRMLRKLPAHFSDHFRAEGLERDFGVWSDLDVLFLKRLPDDDFILGWAEPGLVSGAILKLPPEGKFLADYLKMCRRRPLPIAAPWLPWHERVALTVKDWRRRIRGHRGIRPPYGPPALTHLVEVHDAYDKVRPRAIYHPLDPDEVPSLAQSNDFVPHPDSYTIHLFGSHFRNSMGSAVPPASSWLGAQCARYAIA